MRAWVAMSRREPFWGLDGFGAPRMARRPDWGEDGCKWEADDVKHTGVCVLCVPRSEMYYTWEG